MRCLTLPMLVLLSLSLACKKNPPAAPPPRPPDPATNCVADKLPPLKLSWNVSSRCAGGDVGCRDECFGGSASACLSRALALQESSGDKAEIDSLFAKACELGAANGCTNYAAALWSGEKTDAGQACAERLFLEACYATDPFACGMLGRLMVEDTEPPKLKEAKTHLESSCERLKGFPCRVLARHLENGKLGTATAARIQELLKRACEGGDPGGCESPPTAEGTFGNPE